MERRLPADLGHEPADDPDAGCALHGRGALPRPEGRGRLARLRRAHEVRRSLAGGGAGIRRGAGDGDGSRDPEGVLRRSRGAVLPGLRAAVHRPAAARDVARARGRRVRRPTGCCARRTSSGAGGERTSTPSGSRWCSTRATGEPAVPNGSVGHRYGAATRTLEPAPGRDRARADADRPRERAGARSTCRASTSARARAARSCAAACPPSGSADSW